MTEHDRDIIAGAHLRADAWVDPWARDGEHSALRFDGLAQPAAFQISGYYDGDGYEPYQPIQQRTMRCYYGCWPYSRYLETVGTLNRVEHAPPGELVYAFRATSHAYKRLTLRAWVRTFAWPWLSERASRFCRWIGGRHVDQK